jgi:UDP-N-acetylmuramate dehydrogenase
MTSSNDFAPIRTPDVPLARLTSIKVGGPARFLFEPRSPDEVKSLVLTLQRESILYRLIGGGTNIVASDQGFPGAVIRLAGEFTRVSFDATTATGGAATSLPRFVRECAERGLSGAEGLVGIPGTLGGALVMNAGGQWGDISAIVRSVTILSPSLELREIPRAEIEFRYRHSSLRGSVVLGATFALTESTRGAVETTTGEHFSRKRASQDLAAWSAGCFFKNPSGQSAGALIDQAGLKGAVLGGAKVSEIHANFIVNTGSATASDVTTLAETVRARVADKFGVNLEYEVELW